CTRQNSLNYTHSLIYALPIYASIAEGWQQISPAQGEGAWRELIYRIGPDRFVDRVLVAWARSPAGAADAEWQAFATQPTRWTARSEEHTSELQSRSELVCRLL